MMNSFPRVGLLGGGQLAQMLCLAGAPLGLEMHVLSPYADDPAAQVTSHWHQGSPDNPADLKRFSEQVDFLSFESEFFSAELLRQNLQKPDLRIFPSLDCLGLLQDRLSQKQLLLDNKIATSPFTEVKTIPDLHLAMTTFPDGFVLKKRKNGYDGKGTHYCRTPQELREVQRLISLNKGSSVGFIAEAFVAFKRECALMFFRNSQGQVLSYPLVESRQKDSRCDWVVGPEKHPAVKKLTAQFSKLLKKIDYVGALGVELFDCETAGSGRQLLVNELAPRVHNSGHYSQEALNFDQFRLHLMCGLGHTLPKIQEQAKAFAMINLIGESSEQIVYTGGFLRPQSQLHWYGKTQSRPGRKMGHLNLLGEDKKLLLANLIRARKTFKL